MYRKSTLENGIRIVTETMTGHRSISVGIVMDTGPGDESADQHGLAHLAEHALFCGTSSRTDSQIASLIDESGGHMGAFTTRDYTCFMATVLDDYFTYALDLLGDILLNSIFPPEDLEYEKEAILREIDAAGDLPFERTHNLLKSFVWKDHHLGRSITGRPETVQLLTREDVIYFIHQHYSPDRMIVAAAGNLNHEDFVAQVRDAFWRMIGSNSPRKRTLPIFQSGEVMYRMPVSQGYFSMGIPTCSYTDPDRYGMHLINNILGNGISSRLFRQIRSNRGLAYQIGSEYHAYRDAGMLIIEGSASPEKLPLVLRVILDELWRLLSGCKPIEEEELWKAKMYIRAQHLISGENTDTRMSRLATQELYFRRRIPDKDIVAQINVIEGRELQGLAERLLHDGMMQAAVAIVGPEDSGKDLLSSVKGLLGEKARLLMMQN